MWLMIPITVQECVARDLILPAHLYSSLRVSTKASHLFPNLFKVLVGSFFQPNLLPYKHDSRLTSSYPIWVLEDAQVDSSATLLMRRFFCQAEGPTQPKSSYLIDCSQRHGYQHHGILQASPHSWPSIDEPRKHEVAIERMMYLTSTFLWFASSLLLASTRTCQTPTFLPIALLL